MTPQAGFRLKIAKTGSEVGIVTWFNEATGFDVQAEVTEMKRSLPNGTAWISQTPYTFAGSVPDPGAPSQQRQGGVGVVRRVHCRR